MLVWSVAAITLAGILFRPKAWPEAIWACLGASILVFSGLLSFRQAVFAAGKGTDVYFFLTGMMLMAELARHQGVFDWLASLALGAARNSQARLFTLIYCVGILVTVFLSNDATAVVLTPAVYAAVRKSKAEAMPHLMVCAFIANAASFVLPISNPANLVVYGRHLPPLLPWLKTFFLPSILSIAATYFVLRWLSRSHLQGLVENGESVTLSPEGRLAAWGIMGTGLILTGASALDFNLGLPTCIAAAIAVLIATRADKKTLAKIVREVSWSVLPLVAGLFILVEALNGAGALHDLSAVLGWCSAMPPIAGALSASFGVALLSNVMNNLPSGLMAGGALQSASIQAHIRDAVLLGVDIGPNLSVTGSLATVLWLMALRREGEFISGWQFLKTGICVMPPALLLSTLALALLSK